MTILRYLLSLFFVIAGTRHFLSPQAYMQIMPPFLPSPLFLIYLSGVCEVAGGIGVLLPRSRRIAGYGLIALLIAVFPANIYMAVNHLGVSGTPLPDWLLWLRLPLQAVLILWVWICAIKSQTNSRAKTHTLKT